MDALVQLISIRRVAQINQNIVLAKGYSITLVDNFY